MRAEIFKCDVCGSERKEANHWFSVFDKPEDQKVMVYKWPVSSLCDDAIHVCGEMCLQQKVMELMGK